MAVAQLALAWAILDPRIVDLGVGIPAHIRRAYPRLTGDGDAIAEATRESINDPGTIPRSWA